MKLGNGSIEALKWLALLFMTADHINKYLFNGTMPVLFEVGRIALPIFVFVLAFNLSRDGTLEKGTYKRAEIHLFIFAVIASIPYILMSGYTIKLLPLNILFTLLATTLVIENIDKRRMETVFAAVVIFIISGYFVEYWWPAMAMGVSAWAYFKFRKTYFLALTLVFCLSLYFVNGNFWALASLPIVYTFTQFNVNVPRLKWIFYVYYPLHLFAFYLIRIPLKKAGYLFF